MEPDVPLKVSPLVLLIACKSIHFTPIQMLLGNPREDRLLRKKATEVRELDLILTILLIHIRKHVVVLVLMDSNV
jgi:hypothetical protein